MGFPKVTSYQWNFTCLCVCACVCARFLCSLYVIGFVSAFLCVHLCVCVCVCVRATPFLSVYLYMNTVHSHHLSSHPPFLFLSLFPQPTACLRARTEECASGRSSASARQAQRARYVSRSLCPPPPTQACLGTATPTAPPTDIQTDTMWCPSGPSLSRGTPLHRSATCPRCD